MPTTVKVVTTIAMKTVLEALAPEFARATGAEITMAFGPPVRAVQMVRDGEATDIVMTTPEGMAELAAAGKVAPGSGRVFASMVMGLAVRAGAHKPDISTVKGFKHAILGAKSLIHADPHMGSPSAAHFLKVANQLGIADAIKPKTTVFAGVVAPFVARGEVEMAIQQLSELMMADGVEIVGLFPPELQNIVPLAAAVVQDAQAPEAARALIDLLFTERAKAILNKSGLVAVP